MENKCHMCEAKATTSIHFANGEVWQLCELCHDKCQEYENDARIEAKYEREALLAQGIEPEE